jgi:hypothetical protein
MKLAKLIPERLDLEVGDKLVLSGETYTVLGKKGVGYTVQYGRNKTHLETDWLEYVLQKPGNKIIRTSK